MHSQSLGDTYGASLLEPYLLAGLLSSVLGAFFILGVGLAGSEVIHNAAHDIRHALAFPCH